LLPGQLTQHLFKQVGKTDSKNSLSADGSAPKLVNDQ